MSIDCELTKGRSYIVEWVDSLNFAGWNTSDDIEKIALKTEDVIITYGEYVGMSDGGIYISLAQSLDKKKGVYSNVIKIPIKCIMKINEMERGMPSTIPLVAFLALFIGMAALYFSFNPPQVALEKNIRAFTSETNLIEE